MPYILSWLDLKTINTLKGPKDISWLTVLKMWSIAMLLTTNRCFLDSGSRVACVNLWTGSLYGKRWKNREEREVKGGESVDKPLKPIFCPLVLQLPIICQQDRYLSLRYIGYTGMLSISRVNLSGCGSKVSLQSALCHRFSSRVLSEMIVLFLRLGYLCWDFAFLFRVFG